MQRNILILTLLLFLTFTTTAQQQGLYSTVEIDLQSKNDTVENAVSNKALVWLNPTNGVLVLKVEISTITTRVPKMDSALIKLAAQYLYFKGTLANYNELFSQENKDREYMLQGELMTQEAKTGATMIYDPENLGNSNDLKAIRLKLTISISPKDLYIPILSDNCDDRIVIEMRGAQINPGTIQTPF
jgi:hypothetical protein